MNVVHIMMVNHTDVVSNEWISVVVYGELNAIGANEIRRATVRCARGNCMGTRWYSEVNIFNTYHSNNGETSHLVQILE